MKRWKVRGGMIFRSADGKTTLSEGTQFEGTEEDVAHMRTHLEPVIAPAPELKPEPDPIPERYHGRSPKNRAMRRPNRHTSM